MSFPDILYDSILVDADLTATGTDTDYDIANITDLRPYTFWKAASSGGKYITIDAGADVSADALAILSHNLNTVSASVKLQTSATGAWSGEQVTQVSPFYPADDGPIYSTFDSVSSRYWRIVLGGSTAAMKIAIVMLGSRLSFPKHMTKPVVPVSEGIDADVLASKYGHILQVTTRLTPITARASFQRLDWTWVRDTYKPFWTNHGQLLKPFVWVPDLDAYPESVFLVAMSPATRFEPSMRNTETVDRLSFDMRGVLL